MDRFGTTRRCKNWSAISTQTTGLSVLGVREIENVSWEAFCNWESEAGASFGEFSAESSFHGSGSNFGVK